MGIDFSNKKVFKLNQENIQNGINMVAPLLVSNENVIGSYVSMRDRVVFTNKRIISINVQGITGTKKDFFKAVFSFICYRGTCYRICYVHSSKRRLFQL